MAITSYVAIGDSFTEGMGDRWPDGVERGWADLVAMGLSAAAGRPIAYANLAIRGRMLDPLLAEQLAPAIAMRPDLLTINGGGNDIMRPRISIDGVAGRIAAAAEEAAAAGIRVLLVSGADPSEHLPLGPVMRRRGVELTDALVARLASADAGRIAFCDNFADPVLRRPEHWSDDGLHLNGLGHRRVAANVLRALGIEVAAASPAETAAPGTATDFGSLAYWRAHVVPWIGRRLTGRSSGDGRAPKRPDLVPFDR